MARAVLVFSLWAAGLSSSLHAQVRAGAVVEGTVSGVGGTPLPSVRVLRLGASSESVRTDTAGRYRFTGLAQGTHLLSYQLVGYVPATVLVQIRLDTTLTVDVPMERQAVVLDTLRVMAAPAGAYERKLRSVGFEMRRRDAERTATDATFIAPDEIARRRPARISQLLEGRRSVHVQYLANGFGAIARGRDGHCIMTVWLDGQLVYPDIGSLNSTGSAGMGSGLGVTQGGNGLTLATRAGGDAAGMNVIDVNQIAAIEVYPSPSGTPPQFQMLTGSCGAIVMWSKQ